MKNIFFSFILIAFLVSCSSFKSNYEKVIIDFIETGNGVKTDLKIKFSNLEISDILVSDSITILKERFEAERAKQIRFIEQTIKHKENSIAEQRKSDDQFVAGLLITTWEKDIIREKQSLEKVQDWKPTYLNRYDSRNSSEILAKKADTTFSYYNPHLKTRQTMSASFILSADGKECRKMISQQ